MNSTTIGWHERGGGRLVTRNHPGADQLGTTPETTRAAENPAMSRLATLALVWTVLVAFVPSLPSWFVAWKYHAISRLPTIRPSLLGPTSQGTPHLLGAESVAAAPDGTLVATDWVRRGVLAIRPDGSTAWQPLRGRFLPQVAADGRLHLLDVDTGYLYRYTASGQLDRRVAVAPPGAAPVFCIAEDGRVLVAAAGTLTRLTADLSGADPSWGDAGKPVAAPGVVGLATRNDRVWAATGEDRVLVFSSVGILLRDEPLVGNAGPLAVSPDGTLALADRRTGRVFIMDHQGQVRGRLVSAAGKAPVTSLRGFIFLTEHTLAVATGSSIEILTVPELP